MHQAADGCRLRAKVEGVLDGVGIILKSPIEHRADHEQGRLIRLLSAWQTQACPRHAMLPSGRFVPQRVRAPQPQLPRELSVGV